jgi:hypothetical protein
VYASFARRFPAQSRILVINKCDSEEDLQAYSLEELEELKSYLQCEGAVIFTSAKKAWNLNELGTLLFQRANQFHLNYSDAATQLYRLTRIFNSAEAALTERSPVFRMPLKVDEARAFQNGLPLFREAVFAAPAEKIITFEEARTLALGAKDLAQKVALGEGMLSDLRGHGGLLVLEEIRQASASASASARTESQGSSTGNIRDLQCQFCSLDQR